MSDNKKITDGRGRNGDGIIDAEFVEIGQEQAHRGRHDPFGYGGPPKQLSWWARLGKIGKVVAGLLSSILMLKGCDAFLGMVTREPSSANSQASSEAVGTNVGGQGANSYPSYEELLEKNDSRACVHPNTMAGVRETLFPDTMKGSEYNVSDQELTEAISLIKFDIQHVTLASIDKDIHEFTCEGVLHYYKGLPGTTDISYTIRPGADPTLGAQFTVTVAPVALDRILALPLEMVKNRKRASAEP